jgi:hypothetical protein
LAIKCHLIRRWRCVRGILSGFRLRLSLFLDFRCRCRDIFYLILQIRIAFKRSLVINSLMCKHVFLFCHLLISTTLILSQILGYDSLRSRLLEEYWFLRDSCIFWSITLNNLLLLSQYFIFKGCLFNSCLNNLDNRDRIWAVLIDISFFIQGNLSNPIFMLRYDEAFKRWIFNNVFFLNYWQILLQSIHFYLTFLTFRSTFRANYWVILDLLRFQRWFIGNSLTTNSWNLWS